MISRSNKYHARKVVLNGITFDSAKEADRYWALRILEKRGKIEDLRLQVSFELVPKSKEERAVKYIADFVYREDGNTVVEDVKGMRTKDYIIKRKLLKWRYPEIKFKEV